jgi:phosphatidylinositol glycan class F
MPKKIISRTSPTPPVRAKSSSLPPKPTNVLIYGFTYAIAVLSFIWSQLLYSDLTVNPRKNLEAGIPVLVVIQLLYCVFGHLEDNWKLSQPGRAKKLSEPSIRRNLLGAILSVVLSLALSLYVYILLFLFGAPLSEGVVETLLCAVHISLLSVQPLIFVYKLDSKIWKDVVSIKLPLDGLNGAATGTWLGAWLGAVPIPLDWDRPWQKWPITIVVGAYCGAVIGTMVGCIAQRLRAHGVIGASNPGN